MSSSNSNVQILTQDWVQKIHFENKVDLNLQIPSKDESIKIEVDEIPVDYLPKIGSTTKNEYKNDSYLQSILSSSPSPNTLSACTGNRACTCYKCQRQRRRAGMTRGGANNNDKSNRAAEETFSSSSSSPLHPPHPTSPVVLPVESPKSMSPTIVAPLTPAQSPQPQKAKRSNTLRKTPTLKSYEKHMPKPTYSQKDSIYRIDEDENSKKRREEGAERNMRPTEELQRQDNYRMAWKEDETGDDLLSSLVTFQTIFEEKGNENEGLSDLLEQKAQELKYQKLREQAEALNPKKNEEDVLPPRRSDCLTLSYRNGAKHNPLTLYHTMKMAGEQQRMSAYNVAFKHCINANSGLRSWMKRARVAPTRENSKLIQPARKVQPKRSLLHPLGSRKNKADDLLIWSSSSEHLAHGKRSIDMISSPIPIQRSSTPEGGANHSQPTDVLSAAQALLPNQNLFHQQQGFKSHKVPYDHIDTPSIPRQSSTTAPVSPTLTADMKDTSSTSSAESVTGRTTISSNTSSKLMKSRPGRLFSSLSRKTSLRSHSSISNKASSIKSMEKIDSIEESPSHEKVLDDLCRILPHIDRAELSPYVHEANNDYMTALQLCKAAVISGKLS